jgi:hypothetical protein
MEMFLTPNLKYGVEMVFRRRLFQSTKLDVLHTLQTIKKNRRTVPQIARSRLHMRQFREEIPLFSDFSHPSDSARSVLTIGQSDNIQRDFRRMPAITAEPKGQERLRV